MTPPCNKALAALERLSLFSDIAPEQRLRLAAACRLVIKQRGTFLFQEGDAADVLPVLWQGRVKVFKTAPDGRETLLHVFGPGAMVGEAAFFRNAPFPATALCLEDVQAVLLPRAALAAAMAEHPDLAMALLAALSERLRILTGKLEALTVLETPRRLAAYLLDADARQGGTGIFTLEVSKELLAGLLGASRETVSRALGRLADQKAIELRGRDIRLVDRGFLLRLVHGDENR